MQTAVVWSCLPFIRSGQNHFARHSERGKKARQTEKEVGRQHQGMDRPGVRQVPEGSGEQGKKEKTGCKIICGAPACLSVKGLMLMMMRQLCLQESSRAGQVISDDNDIHEGASPNQNALCRGQCRACSGAREPTYLPLPETRTGPEDQVSNGDF